MLFKFAMTSAQLAVKGKLVRSWGFVIPRGLLGFAIGAGAFAACAVAGLGLLGSALLAGGVCGFLMPFLLRDMKAH